VGQTVAIATHRAQTTRRRIRGIVNREDCQVVFVDTPGLHLVSAHGDVLNRYMLEEARAALAEVDVAVLLVEALGRGSMARGVDKEDELALDAMRRARCPRLLAVNKIDLLRKKELLLPLLAAYEATGLFDELIPLSAKTGDGSDRLLDAIASRLPAGPRYFPEDMITDEPERQLAAEFIREQVLLNADKEVPYSTAVEIIGFEEQAEEAGVHIHAVVYVERKSQKGILIGKGGQRLKTIGSAARRSIERMLGCHVFLDIRVKVKRGWSRTSAGLRSVGYGDP
jgi:GTP-binding protein Era